MSASDALVRLARYGLWVDAAHPAAQPWIEEHAKAARIPFDEMAARLAHDPKAFQIAIRRQWHSNILWYVRSADEVLHRCTSSPANQSVLDALQLHEPDSRPPLEISPEGRVPDLHGVVLDGAGPVAVNVPMPKALPPSSVPQAGPPAPAVDGIDRRTTLSGGMRGGPPQPLAPFPPPISASPPVTAWPRIEAPTYTPAGKEFDVKVGFAALPVAGVSGGQVVIHAPAGATSIEVDVELIADGVAAIEGWTRKLLVQISNPTAAEVSFLLKGSEPSGPEPVHLTTLEVRYLYQGSVCGIAARPLIVGRSGVATLQSAGNFGTAWELNPPTGSPVTVVADPQSADLTIEIAKPDKNDAGGRFVCRLYSPHALMTPRGPFDIDLGQDAKTFAKETVEDIRLYSGSLILASAITARARLVADRLPAEAIDALREVAGLVAPKPPAVLIVSAEPYVPWELAQVDPPLDKTLPPYLGAQALVGRWLREGSAAASPSSRIPKPPVEPLSAMSIKHMAVMVGLYTRAQGGLQSLPFAKQEADTLTQTYKAVPLAASAQALAQLLDAKLEQNFEQIGGADAVHFAGHGEFDPARPDSSVLYLSDGTPMKSLLFRSASYGGAQQPLMFMNACMIGLGGEVLGSTGGFPGNCLKGGFGAFVGALWEVDDSVAHDVALEFWQRALPTNGTSGEPIGMILRDLRAKYAVKAQGIPVSTYLAYVYYGHPRLTLRQAA